jgi:hypothetical protein
MARLETMADRRTLSFLLVKPDLLQMERAHPQQQGIKLESSSGIPQERGLDTGQELGPD